jgi:hypothetical protein
MFEQRVLPVSEDIIFKWRLLSKTVETQGTASRSRTYLSPRELCIMD